MTSHDTMKQNEPIWAIGLMSGSSLDGIDAAALLTDGEVILEQGPSITLPYDRKMHDRLFKAVHRQSSDLPALERDMTLLHAEAVTALRAQCDYDFKIIGFHGQTVDHRPNDAISVQIGDGALLAERSGIGVINDFRRADIAAGGQGAPLVPLYHRALAADLAKPVAIINIGGVANISWLAEDGKISSFDTGPGNALINDWVRNRADLAFDHDGALAAAGRVSETLLNYYLQHPYFSQPYPKSLDRNAFSLSPIEHLSTEDGAATLTAFTAKTIAMAAQYFPSTPKQWIICGGGCHNSALVEKLKTYCEGEVRRASSLGWNNDGLEAQAFAYFAVRSLYGLPITFPETTGASKPIVGGALHRVF